MGGGADRRGTTMTTHLPRSIGLGGTVFTLIGYVIGASIFILPGELAASSGPAVVLAYWIAAIPAVFCCVVSAQIGSVFPVSGANYVAVSRVVPPFWGFLMVWVLMAALIVGVPLVAYGFADYLAFFAPGLNRTVVALLAVAVFCGVNVLGARLSVWTQSLMVIGFMLALLVFGLGGLPHVRPELLVPIFPRGVMPVVMAAIPAYFSYIGFLVIVELGEEIRNPSRTIPLALTISLGCVLFFYSLVSVVLPGIVPWAELAATDAPVATAAATFLPSSLAVLISLGALLAAATTLNGIILGQSRDLFALARDQVLPAVFGRLHPRFHSPDVAIMTLGVLSAGGVLIGATITEYATLAVLGFMTFQIFSGVGVYFLASRGAERFERAPFRLRPFWRVFFSVGLVVLSALFIALAGFQNTRAIAAFAVYIGLGVAYYEWRRRTLARRGIDLRTALRKDV